ncbi:MAG: nitroreductase family protein [Firmicutes bacterium]|nr:nitroreductase family protein [Bacillota bacterium]
MIKIEEEMTLLNIFVTRRSIRKYTDQAVSASQLEELLRAAMSAPTGKNARPWQFVVIQKREVLDGIPAFAPNTAPLKGAAAAIVVCGDLSLDLIPGLWVQDCTAATENLLLAAHAIGLGAVWLNVYPNEERVEKMRAYLEMPEHITPLCVVALGYPDEEKELSDRYDPERVHYDHW